MRNDAFQRLLINRGTRTVIRVDLLELILGQASLRSAAYRVSEKALGGKIRSWAIKRYLVWAPWLRGVPGLGQYDFAIIIPVI
jgi:hypothetical protein